jgi:NADH dehydrogenase
LNTREGGDIAPLVAFGEEKLMEGARPRVVIVGGGFGGLYAALGLRRAALDVTLLDRRNHHLFQPLLYQVATAGLSAPDIAAPIRSVLRGQANTTVLLAEVTAVRPNERMLELADGTLAYDFLILATGSTHSYFGHDDWAPFAPGLKDVEDAFEIRTRILLAFERAERTDDPNERARWLTFAIVGGGPTGVELAGAIVEIAHRTMARDFRRFDPRSARVVIVDAGPRVLPTFDPANSRDAEAILKKRGVEIVLDTRVTGVDERGIAMGDRRIDAGTVLWAAGVQISPLGRSLGAPLDKLGRVLVEPDLSVPGHPEIFVIGDLAAVRSGEGFLPGVAQPAIQEGRLAAKNVVLRAAGKPTRAFRYKDLGMLATIGRSAAVADIGGRTFAGFVAWLIWVFIHVAWLIGFRNRLIVMIQWAWAYFAWSRGARVIFDPRSWEGGA